MLAYIRKVSKIGLLALVTLVLTSTTGVPDSPMLLPSLGNYNLGAKGEFTGALKGKVRFEITSRQELPNAEDRITTLELKLYNTDLDEAHRLGFLIAKRGPKKSLVGNHRITDSNMGLINNDKEVFAFADIQRLGERPLFAFEGNINIANVSKTEIEGDLNVAFKDFHGAKIQLTGRFIATP